MKSILTPHGPARAARAAWAAGLAIAGGPWAVAGEPGTGHAFGAFDLWLVLAAGLVVGLLVWAIERRARRRVEQHTARRIHEMTALIEHADGLLWEAEVELKSADWSWNFKLHPSAFCRKLFNDRMAQPGADLWDQFHIATRKEMDRLAREAMDNNRPGYVQEFRAERDGHSFWMHENVSITPLGENRFWLVGLVTDITPQREAEAARRQSELTVDRILAHAQCLLWRATVILEDGVLKWPHFDTPQSQFSELLFGGRVYSYEKGFWDTLQIPEQAEMNERSTKAILGGAEGYAQHFRAINRAGRLFQLHERVSITRVSDKMWSLVGVVTDFTNQHEAEEARRKSETRLGYLLERADSMIWQAQVNRRPDGELDWTMYVPRSQLYRRIFGTDPGEPAGFAWKERGAFEYVAMLHRCKEAITSGAPGYDQVFHVPGPEQPLWLSETVTIVANGPEQWDLVGIITDITARHVAEEAWQATQARLGKLLELADCLVWEATVTLRPDDTVHWDLYTQRSVLYRRIFGDRDETVLNWHTLVVPELPEMTARTLRAVKARAPGYTQEFHVENPDEVIWLRETVTMVQLTETTFRLVGVITDITAQRRAEEAQQQSELRLAALLERADCMIWQGETRRLGPDDYAWKLFTPRSQLYRRIFDRDPAGSQHFDWGDKVPEVPEMRVRAQQAMAGGRTGYEQVFHYQHPRAGDIWLNEKVSIRPLGPDQWELIGIITDITAQRGAEEALAAEKERLAVTLRAMSECVITTDVAGLIQFMNPAAAALTGWEETAAFGRPAAEICRLQDSGSGQPVAVPVIPVVRSDAVVDLPAHTRLLTRTGDRRLIEGCCAPIHAADGSVIGTVLVFRDVTEQERLEQELVRATRLESVGVLAGGIAHDFNNILTAVMGNLALAQLDIAPESPAGASLRSAEKAALRARDLTQQLLTFAKGGEPVRAAVQLAAIVREMAAFALHGSQVKATYDMAPDLWPADADKGQIGRVVQNIVLNAVQAMPRGGTLQIMARNDSHDSQSQPGLQPGKYIQLAITDTGVGIKPEHLARIFDPYFTTKQSGTGLGLAAVYSIVKKHRGHIEVESQLGQGTTFRVWLPALHEHQGSADSRPPWGGAADRLNGRVLFMDDEESIRTMAEALLTRFGLTVDCAIDGAEAVTKYREALAAGARYDLVIMDLTVPGGMGGLAALGHLRALDPTVKAVVSSGYSSDPVLANHRAHGFAAVMAKPYEATALSRVLHEVLAAP